MCSTCLRQVEAKIVIKDDERVYLDKWCPVHGTERVLVADDAAYYRLGREVFVKAPSCPPLATGMRHGCPYDCGLCPDHAARLPERGRDHRPLQPSAARRVTRPPAPSASRTAH